MPLVSREWANALSEHSVAWEHLDLTQPPADWSKLALWASRHCRHTHALTIDNISRGSEDGLVQLLRCGFQHLRSIKLLGSVCSSSLLWISVLFSHKLENLHVQLESFDEMELDGLEDLHLQHLVLEFKEASPFVRVHLPSNFQHLQSLSLRNVPLASNVFPGGYSCLLELSLVRTGVRSFDFTSGGMNHLTSLLLSEDYRPGQHLELSGISALTSLKRLSISSGLEQFPDDILSITSVTSLDLGWNKFRMLPAGPYLTNLKELQFQERSSFLDVSVLEKTSELRLLSFDATDMAYNDIIAMVIRLIKRLSKLQRIVLLKASYNGAADREDQIAQSFLKLVNLLCQDMFCRRSIQIDLEHKWKPLLWCDTGR